MVLHEQADLALATESLALTPGLATLPVYAWEHTVVVRPDHPLAELTSSAAKNLTLAQLAEYPIVTYDRAFTGRSRSEEHTSELQSLMRISYAVFCLKKKNTKMI